MLSTFLDTLRRNRARDGWRRWSFTSNRYAPEADGWRLSNGTSARSIRRRNGLSARQFRIRVKAHRRGTMVTRAAAQRRGQAA